MRCLRRLPVAGTELAAEYGNRSSANGGLHIDGARNHRADLSRRANVRGRGAAWKAAVQVGRPRAAVRAETGAEGLDVGRRVEEGVGVRRWTRGVEPFGLRETGFRNVEHEALVLGVEGQNFHG